MSIIDRARRARADVRERRARELEALDFPPDGKVARMSHGLDTAIFVVVPLVLIEGLAFGAFLIYLWAKQ